MTTKLHKAYSKNKNAYYYFKCDCSNMFIARYDANPKSCGCLIGKPKTVDIETNINQIESIPKTHKRCFICKESLTINSFHKNCNKCKECTKTYNKKWQKDNRDKTKLYSRKHYVGQKGITVEEQDNINQQRREDYIKAQDIKKEKQKQLEIKRQELEQNKLSPVKECVKCGEIKPKSEFFKAKGKTDGYDNRCKECEKLRLRRERNMQPKVHRTPEEIKIRKKLQKHKRRFREQQGKIKPNEIKELKIKQNNRCYWCSISIAKTYHIDHYEPLSKGGEHLIENIVLACPHCNMSKHDKDPIEFANKLGRLL